VIVESLLSRGRQGASASSEAAGPRDECVHRLFEAQAARTPEAVAVEWDTRALTYHEINARADRVARHLQSLGVGPDVRVGICIERSLEMVVGLLGILKAGGAYLPLEPAYPGERLAYMLADAGAPVLLTGQRMRASLPPVPTGVRCVDVDDAEASAGSAENPAAGVSAENLAYVIYTSGSTGRPKGVAMGHRPLVNLIEWQLASSTVPATARTLPFTSLSFDVSFQEIFATLCGGGTLVLVADEVRRDAGALLRFLAEKRVERLFLPFVAFQQLGEATRGAGLIPTHLREIITAGEQLQISEPVADLLARLPGCTLHNH
jgi:non-ribosomal peptide synthetase component F